MFTVTGIFEEEPYGVAIGPDPLHLHAWGVMSGSPKILALLFLREGQQVRATPVGPTFTVDRNDPASLLGALYALTHVVEVSGEDAPQIFPSAANDDSDEAVY